MKIQRIKKDDDRIDDQPTLKGGNLAMTLVIEKVKIFLQEE
jgi:hypothetical protein